MNTIIPKICVLAALAGFCAVQSGCHCVRRGEPLVGPLDVSDARVYHGRQIFMQHCYQCHPNGEGGLGPALNNKPAPRFAIKTQVRIGLGAMPAFDKNKISPADLEDLADYVVALRRQDMTYACQLVRANHSRE